MSPRLLCLVAALALAACAPAPEPVRPGDVVVTGEGDVTGEPLGPPPSIRGAARAFVSVVGRCRAGGRGGLRRAGDRDLVRLSDRGRRPARGAAERVPDRRSPRPAGDRLHARADPRRPERGRAGLRHGARGGASHRGAPGAAARDRDAGRNGLRPARRRRRRQRRRACGRRRRSARRWGRGPTAASSSWRRTRSAPIITARAGYDPCAARPSSSGCPIRATGSSEPIRRTPSGWPSFSGPPRPSAREAECPSQTVQVRRSRSDVRNAPRAMAVKKQAEADTTKPCQIA